MSKNAVPSNTLSSIRILKIATCPTCSGKATLTYHIGCNSNSEINFQIIDNTGGGFFSKEWVSLRVIQAALSSSPKPITSLSLSKLFQGKSVNTPAFLIAVLKSEHLLKQLEGKEFGYECTDVNVFVTEITRLISSKIDLKSDLALPTKNATTPSKKTSVSNT